MRFPLKQLALAGLLTCLGVSAFAVNYHFVMPKSWKYTIPVVAQISPHVLPEAVVGLPYNSGLGFDLNTLLSVTGDAEFNPALAGFAVTQGQLPVGLVINAQGVLVGTPLAAKALSPVQVTVSYKSAKGVQTYQVVSLDIQVSLAASTLPAAALGATYNGAGFDFKSKLTVTGDLNYTANQVAFSLAAFSLLPPGLSINDSGILSGTPTSPTTGIDVTVQATYKQKTGQQVYTIVVNGVQLEVIGFATGVAHTCVITPVGGMKCWGRNTNGQLGDGTFSAKFTPTDVSGLTSGVSSIAVGDNSTCAVTSTGAAKCWGINTNGQLGDNTLVSKSLPTDVYGLSAGVVQIDSGAQHTCAVLTSGGVQCWGLNTSGQLGDNSLTGKPVPTQVSGLAGGVAKVSTGGSHSCAVTTSGGLKCWGLNSYGQLGDTTLVNKQIPTEVYGLQSGVTSVTGGLFLTCATISTGAAKCWGQNAGGQLGDGTLADKKEPTQVTGLTSGVSSIASGDNHSCAVVDGAVKCWGLNVNGQLGDGTTSQRSLPTLTSITSGATRITTGTSHSCALVSNGTAKCWGANGFGQLGNGGISQQLSPVTVSP